MRFLAILFSFFVLFSHAQDLDFEFSANVTGVCFEPDSLLLGFDNGEFGRFNLESKKYSAIMELPKISSTLESGLGSRITSLASLGDKIALLHDGDFASKKISIFSGGKLQSFDAERGVKQIYFLDDKTLLLVSLSSEIYELDITNGAAKKIAKLTYSSWISESEFSRDSGVLVAATEGGVVVYFDLRTRKILKNLEIQKDILYSLAAQGERFVAGSAENIAYYFDGSMEHIFRTNNTHVFKVALSESLGAYYTDGGYIALFDAAGGELRRIAYDGVQVANMHFWGDFLITSGYDSKIYFWRVK